MEDSDSFCISKDTTWKDTIQDGVLLFNNAKPAIVEKTIEELNKKGATESSKYELTEANCIKTLKGESTVSIVTNKLFYYPKKKAIYNVISEAPNLIKLLKHKGSEEIILEDQNEISTLRDYIFVNIKIYTQTSADSIINTPVKLQSKLDKELSDPIMGATGKTLTMFKFFKDSKLLDKEAFISSFDDVEEDMFLLATTGFSKASMFKRFHKPYEWPYWGYYGTNVDACCFVPNQTVIFCGFTLYSTDQPSFEVKYKIYVDDKVVEEEDKMLCSEWEEKYYFRIKTKNLIEVKNGSKLEITAQIAKSFSDNSYISCYYGQEGDKFAEVDNEHMGLWTVEYCAKSNSSSVGWGNFPEIYYYL